MSNPVDSTPPKHGNSIIPSYMGKQIADHYKDQLDKAQKDAPKGAAGSKETSSKEIEALKKKLAAQTSSNEANTQAGRLTASHTDSDAAKKSKLLELALKAIEQESSE